MKRTLIVFGLAIAALMRLAAIALLAVLATGCATSNTPGDPLEGFNRAMFSFNEGFDNVVMKPVASGYKAVAPAPGFFRVSAKSMSSSPTLEMRPTRSRGFKVHSG